MPNNCCIRGCKNTNLNSFHLFRFPLSQPEILKMWIDAIGRKNFQPTKTHRICSAHFKAEDYMDRPETSGVRLKNLAVPSIYSEIPAPAPTSAIVNCVSNSFAATKCNKSQTNSPSAKAWRSILKPNVDELRLSPHTDPTSSTTCTETYPSIVLPDSLTASNSNALYDTNKITKKRNIMDHSAFHFKKQEMSPRKQRMHRTIKTLNPVSKRHKLSKLILFTNT